MILNPRFHQPLAVDRARELTRLGLDPSRPTGIVMFGGEGSPAMIEIARALDASGMDLQIIAVCGKGKRIEAAMKAMPRRIRMHVEGFTREVPRFMRLSDFFIGKPGPGSISEAVAMGLPVIVECNHWTLPQERYNAEWVREQGVGIELRSFRRGIVQAVRQMVDPQRRCEFQKRVRRQNNQAVFEIPDILRTIQQRIQQAQNPGQAAARRVSE